MWETRHGLRVDMLAAFAYVLGPISGACALCSPCRTCALLRPLMHVLPTALTLLIVETYNDFVRFHGTFELSLDAM